MHVCEARPCYRAVPVARRAPSDEPHTNRSPLVTRPRCSASRRPTQKPSRTIPLGLPPNERVLQEHAVCAVLDEQRRAIADDSHEQGRGRRHQLPARPRSPQQEVEHAHLFVARRLVAQQFGQQRQLKTALPSSRGRRRVVRTHHQRVRDDIHTPFHTRGRRRRTNDIANAPFWWMRSSTRGTAPLRL